MTGNANGYKYLTKQLSLLGLGQRVVEIQLTVPQLAPPIQWAPSSLGKKAVASIQDIESDLKKHVDNFDGFVWYRYLKFVLQDAVFEASSQLIGNRVIIELSLPQIAAWIESLSDAGFLTGVGSD
ncbi:MAG: hypothetical protein AAFX95_16130 [Cyanobacteria bacterium J06639_16]